MSLVLEAIMVVCSLQAGGVSTALQVMQAIVGGECALGGGQAHGGGRLVGWPAAGACLGQAGRSKAGVEGWLQSGRRPWALQRSSCCSNSGGACGVLALRLGTEGREQQRNGAGEALKAGGAGPGSSTGGRRSSQGQGVQRRQAGSRGSSPECQAERRSARGGWAARREGRVVAWQLRRWA